MSFPHDLPLSRQFWAEGQSSHDEGLVIRLAIPVTKLNLIKKLSRHTPRFEYVRRQYPNRRTYQSHLTDDFGL